MSKVFLSYSHKDEEFVKELYKRLTRDKVNCFFDKESIEWGSNFVVELEKGLDECEIVVPVLTSAYCNSKWSELERTSVVADDPENIKRKMRPLLLENCIDLIPRFLKPIQSIDVTTNEKFEDEYLRICRALGGVPPDPDLDKPDRKKLPPVCKLPHKNRMPYRSLGNGFVGRVNDLWSINDILQKGELAVVEGVGVVMGTGGLGKTQLAIEYVHRFCNIYPGGVFWVEADLGISVMIDVVSRTAEIKIDNKLTEKEQLESLWRAFYGPRVLIVLDNFPEEGLLKPWLPPYSHIHTLVTTRRRDLECARIPLDLMTSEEGAALINSGNRSSGTDAGRLSDTLGGLPLALEIARHFLDLRSNLTVLGLLEEIDKIGEIEALNIFARKYADELPSGHVKEITVTFQLSWELASSTAKKVMQTISILAPAPVPRRLVRRILNLSSETSLTDPVDDAVSELVDKLSLLELDDEHDPFVHRLVSGFVRSITGEDMEFCQNLFKTVEAEMARSRDEKDQAALKELEKIIPHAEVVVVSSDMDVEMKIEILDSLLRYNKNCGCYRIAEAHGIKALSICHENFDADHPSISISQSNLAMVLQDLGDLEGAKSLLEEALESDKNSFEPGHPSISIRQSNLAMVLKDLGDLEGAKSLLEEALESDKNSFEPGHPSISIRQSNLAMVLKDLGDLEGAKSLLEEALESSKNSFEPGHPSISISQSNLAMVLKDLGDLEGAKSLLEEALESSKNSFEPGHLSISIRQSNLAMVLKDLGDLEGAKSLLEEALESDKNSFEPGHPSISISQSNLAMVLQDLGELEGAKSLLEEALESDKNSFEPGHPSISRSQSNLALVLKDLGELEGAKSLLEEALESSKNSFEPGHPSISISQSNLAMVLKDLGDLEGAKSLLEEALESDKNSFEPGHPSISRSQSNLALVLKDLGELEEARKLAKGAYYMFLDKLGPEHPSTKTVKANWEGML